MAATTTTTPTTTTTTTITTSTIHCRRHHRRRRRYSVFSYQWTRVKASPASLEAAASNQNKNSYNKSVRNALWLVRRCDELLKARES